jgi:hypothetical protein
MPADGNPAAVGEQVITRANNRALRMTATDWVRNGDRWTVLKVSRSGDLTVRYIRNGRTARLPATYVAESVELGYASTVGRRPYMLPGESLRGRGPPARLRLCWSRSCSRH